MSTPTIQIAPWNQESQQPPAETQSSGGLSVAPWNSGSAAPAATEASRPAAPETLSVEGLNITPWSSPSPQNGNAPIFSDQSPRFTPPENPDDNWLQKGWHFLNKPLTESLFGWGQYRQGAGGFERGAEKILSGLTSPLSLITMAAFAPASIGESLAGGAIKEALTDEVTPLFGEALSPTEATALVGKYGEAIKAAQTADLAGQPIDAAVEAAGMDYQQYKSIGDFLTKQGFKQTDVLPEGVIRRMASQGLAKAGIPAGKALQIAKSAEALTTLGFGLNAVRGATYAFPKMAQLLEEGRVNDAMEYLVEGSADTAFGALGIAGGAKSVMDQFPAINEAANLPLTAETQTMKRIAAERDAQFIQGASSALKTVMGQDLDKYQLAGVPVPDYLKNEGSFISDVLQGAKNVVKRTLGISKAESEKLDHTNRVLRTYAEMPFGDANEARTSLAPFVRILGGDEGLQRYIDGTKEVGAQGPTLEGLIRRKQNELRTTTLFAEHSTKEVSDLQDVVSRLDLSFQRAKSPARLNDLEKLLQQKRTELQYASAAHEQNVARLNKLQEWANPTDQTLLKYHEQLLNDIQNAKQGVSPRGENALNQFNEQANNLGEAQRDLSILRNSKPEMFPTPPEEAGAPTGFQPEGAGVEAENIPHQPWELGPRTKYIPDNIEDLIDLSDKARKKLSKDALDSRSKWVDAMIDLTNNLGPESKYAPLLGKIQKFSDDLWALGHTHGLLKSYLENHIRRSWEDDNVGKTFRDELRNGRFATNVLAGRKRYWGTLAEGWARGKDLQVIDPIEMNRLDAVNFAEAIANRNVVHAYIHTPQYDLRGMPTVLLPGRGDVVERPDGPNGDPATQFIINPKQLVSSEVPAEQVERLTNSGQLNELLSTGEIKDRTPQVSLANANDWEEGLKGQQQEMEARNPLLLDVKVGAGNNPHEIGYKAVSNFVSEQAGKDAAHIRNAIEQIKGNLEKTGGKYIGLNPDDVPNDVASNAWLNLLYSGKTISPNWLQQAELWADKREALAQGESASKFWANPQESAIRPSEIARLLFQNRKFIPADLMAYLKRADEKLGTNVAEIWSHRAAGHLIRSIEQAAHADDYIRNQSDLAVLNQVKNLYTSVNPITAERNKPQVEEMLKEINDRQPKVYRYAPKPGDYIEIQHPAFKDWKYLGTNPDGTPVLTSANAMVHKDFAPYLINRLGLDKSGLRGDTGLARFTAPILKGGATAKSLLLSGSPFHIIQEMLRGVMLGINPLIRPNPVADFDTVYDTVRGPKNLMYLASKNGMTMMNKYYGQEFSEGLSSHSGLVSKIPVWGPISDEIHSFLFDRYIPALKISGFRKMFDQYAAKNPDWSDDAVAHAAAEHVNNAFGGQNWREMGRSATTQDWFHIVALAPDWLESEMRFAASIMHGFGVGPLRYKGEEPSFSRKQVATMAVGMYMAARALNMLYSGDPHYEAPFALATKDKEGRTVNFSFRTMPTDILHMASLPTQFALGRISPIGRAATEALTGRNTYGQKLSDAEKFTDMISNFVPIPGQGTFKKLTGQALASDLTSGEQLVKSIGGVGEVYRTPAELKAAKVSSESSEGGPVTPQQIARHRAMLRMEEDIRAGRITNNDVENMIDAGQISEDEGKTVIKTAHSTVGLDPESAIMYSRVNRMTFQNAMDIYNIASPKEKAILQKLIMKKAMNYVKAGRTKMTAGQRLKDPYYLQARQLTQTENEE